MNLIKFSVRRSITVAMFFLGLILFSSVSFSKLSIDLFPEITAPMALVSATYSGASPQEVENMVTKPLEGVLGGVQGMTDIQSVSSHGSSMVMLTMTQGTDMDFATLQIREKVDLVKDMLPDGVSNVMVLKIDVNMMPVMMVGVSGGRDQSELKKVATDVIQPRLERAEGVASVGISGGYDRLVKVTVDSSKLASYGLTIQQLSNIIRGDNLNFSLGSIDDSGKEMSLRLIGEYENLDQLSEMPVPLSNGSVIALKDLATITDTVADQAQISRINGKPGIVFQVMKESGSNTVAVSDAVTKEVKKLIEDLPAGVQINDFFSQADYIKLMIGQLVNNAITGGLLAVLVIFFFLRDLRLTAIIAVSIPISLIGTFTLLFLNHMTLNLMTLGGLALGVGMMVDSSIIILEGICRYREENMPPKEAAIKGATELSMAVVASTLTTIAVFLPIVFTQGMASMFFKDFAFTVAFSLGASLLVSLTLVPMLASKMKSVEKQRKGFKFIEKMKNGTGSGLEKLNAAYARLLNICLKHRRITVSVVFAALIASFAAVPMVGMELMPAFDQGQIAVQLTMDKGMSLAETDEIMQEVEDIIADLGQEVKSNFVTIGSGAGGMMSAGGSAGSDSASCSLILADQDHRRPIAEIGEELRIKLSQIPGTDVSVDTGDISAMMGGGSALSYSLRGDDLDVLEQISLELKDMIIATPGTREVSTSLEGGRPEMQIKINRQKAAQYGLTTGQIATAARSALDGEIAGQYRHNGEEIDIKVMLPDYQTKTSQDIGQVLLATPMGLHIPLDEVAEISISQSPLAIERINNSRVVSISAQVLGRDLNSVAKEIQDKIDDWNLPQGYSLETGGNVQEMTDAFSDLFLALVLAIILVYFVMASLFESLVDPFVVMFSMPTTFIGVVWALALTGRTLNLSSFIGIIMLAGIVVNNGIVLVDCINQLREEGMEMRDAICKAGSIRLRPILMTALTTILAMLPIFLGFGEGNEMSAPMATALVGGLTASTVFTLVFVPVVYSIINDWRDNFHKRFAKKRTDSQKELVENENNN